MTCRRADVNTGAEVCISTFTGPCPRSLVVSAGGLQAGICWGGLYRDWGRYGSAGEVQERLGDLHQSAARVQVKSKSG